LSAVISINGAWATLRGTAIDVLESCLKFEDPKARYNLAFQQKRWDGQVRLHEGFRFPAGVCHVVEEELTKRDIDFQIETTEPLKIDPSNFHHNILDGIELYDHQYEGCIEILKTSNGCIQVPTRGGKAFMMAAVGLYLWQEYKLRTLIVTSRKGLARQTAEKIAKHVPASIPVGLFGDGSHTMGIITCATSQSLLGYQSRTINKKLGGRNIAIPQPPDKRVIELLRSVNQLFLDETHHASSESWTGIAMFCRAQRRHGLSGTPLQNKELADMRMMGCTGPLIYEVHSDTLIDRNIIRRPKICFVMSENATGSLLPKEMQTIEITPGQYISKLLPPPYETAYLDGVVENETMHRAIVLATHWFAIRKRRTLLFTRKLKHFHNLKDAFTLNPHVRVAALSGKDSTSYRDQIKQQLISGELDAVIGNMIMDEGEDFPGVTALIPAEGVTSYTNAIQRIGRGLEAGKDSAETWVLEFAPTPSDKLIGHALERATAYEKHNYPTMVLDQWPEGSPVDARKYPNLLPFETWKV
jgi:superfamily II DNA or RNA helicase